MAVFSFLCNLLALTPSFTLLIFSRKRCPQSSDGALAVIAFVLSVYGAHRLGQVVSVDKNCGELDDLLVKLYVLCFKGAANELQFEGPSMTLKDLHAIRQFVCGNAMTVIFDLPWIPLYFILMYVFHPALSLVALMYLLDHGDRHRKPAIDHAQ